jgi:HEAT repeat protein
VFRVRVSLGTIDLFMAFRQLKKQVLDLLRREDLDAALPAIMAVPPRQVINPLFGALYSCDRRTRWHAVTAMGAVVAALADQDMESARVIMRRLMWNLNDESGGIGWGSPEALGEIMACHAGLAREYAAILISYLNPQGNFLEHEGLQEGAVWATGRIAHADGRWVRDAAPFLENLFSSPHVQLRGLAAWAAAPVATPTMRPGLERLCEDPARVTLFRQRRFVQCAIAQLAADALAALEKRQSYPKSP